MRAISALLLLHFLVITGAPAFITLDFLIERDRIERELCVQRMVPDDQRTCHGECCLIKRLEKSEGREKNLPDQLRTFRIGDMISEHGASSFTVFIVDEPTIWSTLVEETCEGHPRPLAPVPWC